MGMSALEVRRRVMLAQPHEAVASGAVASFRTDVLSPLKMSFDLLPIQTGEGDPSPENIRPITGHDGFTRIRTGKNLFDGEVHNMAFVAKAGGKADIQGNASWRSIYARVEGGKKYTVSRTAIETNRFRFVATIDKPRIGVDAIVLDNDAPLDSRYSVTVTVPNGYNYLFVYLSNQGTTCTPSNYQIEEGTQSTTIETPQFTVKETTFPTPPGTVYSGTVTDNGDGTGTLVVDRVYFVPTSISSVSTASTGVKYAVCDAFPYSIKAESSLSYDKNISSEYQFRKNAPTTPGWFRLLSNRPYIFDNRFTDAATAEAIILDEKPQFVCEMDEPLIYTLSMTALQPLIGQNHIWVDNADSVSVAYWRH